MDEHDGLLFAITLDGQGGGRQLNWNAIETWRPEDGVLWVHLDRTGDKAERWIRGQTDIDEATADTLLRPVANRPRVQSIGDALLIILRGINLNQGNDPDDMVGLHMWISKDKIITLRRRRLMAGTELRDQLSVGKGPKSPSEFLSMIANQLLNPMVPVVDDLDDKVDQLQSDLMKDSSASLRRQLQGLRQEAINLRRYLAPQRDALARFQTEPVSWLQDRDKSFLRESADRTLRFVEDLDSIRERAAIAQDELNNRLNDKMNRTMYLLTVVAALLLPPSLLTGLFGINVAGMPGTESSWAFAAIAILIPLLAIIEFFVLRWFKWV